MKKLALLIFVLLSKFTLSSQTFNFQRTWATYYGDDSLRFIDGNVDSQGNIYLLGSVYGGYANAISFATPNAHQTTYGGGDADVFLSKISPNGTVIWATYFGGEGIDIAEGITIDKNDDVYIIGETKSTQNIATSGAYQPTLNGLGDTFIAKFSPTGAVVWSTYFGGASDVLSFYDPNNLSTHKAAIVCDNLGNLYLYSSADGDATSGTFQTAQSGSSYLISKFSDTGARIWSTYYGINAAQIRGISLNSTGLYLVGFTNDCPPNYQANSYFGTAGSFQPQAGNCTDAFLSKFSFDGNRLWSTYYGNTSAERLSSNAIRCFGNSIYIGFTSVGSNGFSTPGVYQETENSTSNFLAKFDDNGQRIWGTYCGFTNASNTGSIYCNVNVDASGNVYLCGSTNLRENIGTVGSYQAALNADGYDSYVVKFTPDGQRIWGTYYGGYQNDYDPLIRFNGDSFYLLGLTSSTQNMSTVGSYQENYIDNGNPLVNAFLKTNIFMAKFDPVPLSTNGFEMSNVSLFPNPNDGNFSLKIPNENSANCSMEIYDVLGQLVYKQNVKSGGEKIAASGLKTGVYFVEVKSGSESFRVVKMVVE
jgi:hypothetical protein